MSVGIVNDQGLGRLAVGGMGVRGFARFCMLDTCSWPRHRVESLLTLLRISATLYQAFKHASRGRFITFPADSPCLNLLI